MHILLLSQFYPPILGGEERHVRNLALALIQRGHSVAVATLWYPGAAAVERDGDITVYRIRGSLQRMSHLFAESERRHAPPFPDPELVLGLKRVVAREQPDVIHAHNWLVASFLPVKRSCRVPLIVTMHDYGLVCAKKNFIRGATLCDGPGPVKCVSCAAAHFGPVKGAVTALGNMVSAVQTRRLTDKFIAVSRAVARHTGLAEAGVAFEVIENFVPDDIGMRGVSLDESQPDLPDGGFILFVGDVTRLKGVHVLLKAYASLADAPPLVMIGRRCVDTPTELPRNVRLLPPRPHAAVMQAWHRCLFGVVPSVGAEACATVAMEAMACGKALVGTDIGGTPDLVEDGATGLLVPPGDSDALAGAIRRLLDRPQLRERMGEAGRARVERLKATAIVARIERVYADAVAAKAGAQAAPRTGSRLAGSRS